MRSILLVDDDEALVGELAIALRALLSGGADVRVWVPQEGQKPKDTFDGLVDSDTVFVATDYDLTQKGQTGLFGTSIVNWCQARSIPVGDFSRATPGALPKEPDLFEVRVPSDPQQAARFVATLFRGFTGIEDALRANHDLLTRRSPVSALAEILGAEGTESQFALYGVRFGAASGVLMDRVSATASPDVAPSASDKIKLMTYIVGHVLLNGVIRFPGPILSSIALRSYLATDDADAEVVQDLFAGTRYMGFFSDLDRFYWLSKVNDVLDTLMAALPPGFEAETQGEFHRRAIEFRVGHDLARHGCPRCQGQNGGFFCPFTRRTVCVRSDCSVGSNSWVPAGAQVCRIERDFFDEWAPILGL
jgi:hypothetical protein